MADGNLDLFEHPELRALRNFGVAPDLIDKYQVLCIPENIREATTRDELVDAGNALDLTKALKEAGVKTAGSYDLTPEAKTIERRGGDLWFGIVWVLGSVALPFFISVLANIVTSWRSSRSASATKPPTAHIELRLKRGENVVNIDYSGDGETLVDVLQALKRDKGKEQ